MAAMVTETVAGVYKYELTASCNPPPTGLNCSRASGPVTLTFSDSCCGSQIPLDTGNSLLLSKVLPGLVDVKADWTGVVADPTRVSFNIRRGLGKLDLCVAPPVTCTGPPAVLSNVLVTTAVDAAAVKAPATYYYRIQGIGCGGTPGPI